MWLHTLINTPPLLNMLNLCNYFCVLLFRASCSETELFAAFTVRMRRPRAADQSYSLLGAADPRGELLVKTAHRDGGRKQKNRTTSTSKKEVTLTKK